MNIRETCRLAGPDVDSEALARELTGTAPLSESALRHAVGWLIHESQEALEAVFARENAPPALDEVYRRLMRSQRGLSGREVAMRFAQPEARRRFVTCAARWVARDHHRGERLRRRLEFASADLGSPERGQSESEILGALRNLFTAVEVHRFENPLTFREAEPFLAYIRASLSEDRRLWTGFFQGQGDFARVMEQIEAVIRRRLAAEGVLVMTKVVGGFIART